MELRNELCKLAKTLMLAKFILKDRDTRQLICQNSSQNSGEYFNQFTKGYEKDADEQPDEELHRARSERILSAVTSVPMKLGVCHIPLWM